MFSTVELMWFVELKRVVFKIILLRSWSRDANYTARLLQNRAFLEAKYNAHQHSRKAERWARRREAQFSVTLQNSTTMWI